MRALYKLFASSSLALVLLLIFAVSMAIATFVENDFGTATAWKVIYNSWWFEASMLGLGLCFIANIYKYKLFKLSKWPLLLFHLAFIVILIGASITRYYSYGGIMRIREGQTSNVIISDSKFLQAHITSDNKSKVIKIPIEFSPITDNDFSIENAIDGIPFKLSYQEFIPDAVPEIYEDSELGKPLLEMVVSAGNGRQTVFLEEGEIETVGSHNHKIGFNIEQEDVINITHKTNGELLINSPRQLSTFIMATEKASTLKKDSLQTLKLRTLYRDGDMSFVPLRFHESGKLKLISGSDKPKDNDETKDDALILNVEVGGQKDIITLLYRDGFLPTTHELRINDVELKLSYGAEAITTPFSLKLNDFQLDRYPGSTSPSAYASEVNIVDGNTVIPYRIYMNNVLDYKGFRFFQASYDTDELGTVLAVNHDRLGTNITYIGYFLMMIGMFFTLFGKQSRFRTINYKLNKLKTLTTVVFFVFVSNSITAQDSGINIEPELIKQQFIDKQHAELFGRLMVQDLDGRIKPINTLASEFLRKLTRRPYFRFTQEGETIRFNANQAFLALQANPGLWNKIPLIKVDLKKGGGIFSELQISEDGLVSFTDLLDANGAYRLGLQVENANKKKPAERSEQDKEVLKVDERFNILYNLFAGHYLKIFPNKNDENNTWFSHTHHFQDFPKEDGEFASQIIPNYFDDIKSKNWVEASDKLAYIRVYQSVLAKEIIPSRKRIEAELLYNDLNLNFWLFQALFTIGGLMLIMAIIKVFSSSKRINLVWNALLLLTLLCLIVFAGNIVLRWYISQHAPWSNGYEMLVFVAWVLLLCGFITFRKSDFSLPLATIFSGALLFVSYLDWLSPEITNLMPVLKSFWLKVHVATIVSSYAPLALSFLLGIMALVLFIFRNSKNHKIITVKIKELTYINEIAMTIGLFVLATGTFLGGIWANESWGRYWAWDPKETWALISIIVYAIVLHLRFIPAFNNRYVLNMASVFAFGSIIMTSFGVNYYLSGLHSYAAGDPIPIPKFIYVLILAVITISVLAYLKYKKHTALKTEEVKASQSI
ncbi:cytochrome c biogenesis protein [Psychroserpens sp.]|uniref:cytochrome c biogenesis protein n=1 Tax=Psychroserpens sp. TaxID=2020870 RepID=UPI002AA962E6|nr:cytochrome c biogenesis protein CcsA [Psychroserpens sp.]